MEIIQAEILDLLFAVIVFCVGLVTRYATKYLKEKGMTTQLENNKEWVKFVVHAVEQTYTSMNGDEKLNTAKLELVKIMNDKKIKISEKEIDILIEAMVKEMNDSAKSELNK